MKQRLVLSFLTFSLILSFSGILNSRSIPAQMRNVKKWEGEIHYKLDRSEGISDNSISFLKLKGLYGHTQEQVIIDGTVIFEPSDNPNVYVARGKVKYDVSIITISKLGEAMVVHMTEGKGSEIIEPIKEINYLRFNRYPGTYSLSITPGISDEELDSFGVFVESVSEMKVTRALINKMEEHDRKIPFPELLKEMFPDVVKNPDRESIAIEAFDIAFPTSGNTLKGSYKDEKGGIFTWKLTSIK